MVDACEIRAPATVGEMDPDTGLRPEALGTPRYAGRCKVQTYEPQESRPESGDHVYTVQRYAIHVPVGTVVAVGDQVTITAAVLDPDLVGRTYRVAGLLHKTYATAQRMLVDEIVR